MAMDPGTALGVMKAASGAIGGLVKGVGSLFGGRKRRREVRQAKAEYAKQMEGYQNLDTSNLNTGMENTYEDMTVNQQASQFAFEKNDMVMADTMNRMVDASGGAGLAGLAQVMLNQRTTNVVKSAVDLGQQEWKNQMASAGNQAKLDMFERQGAEKARTLQWNKQETLLGMAGQRLAAAKQARTDATNAAIGGFTGAAAGAAGAAIGAGGFGKITDAFKAE